MKINSKRLKNWDYGKNATYLITINCKSKQKFFGEVKDEIMCLSSLGKIANEIWHQIMIQFDYVELGPFQIMPDHMHGIVAILWANTNEENKEINDGAGGITGRKNPMFHQNQSRVIRLV